MPRGYRRHSRFRPRATPTLRVFALPSSAPPPPRQRLWHRHRVIPLRNQRRQTHTAQSQFQKPPPWEKGLISRVGLRAFVFDFSSLEPDSYSTVTLFARFLGLS